MQPTLPLRYHTSCVIPRLEVTSCHGCSTSRTSLKSATSGVAFVDSLRARSTSRSEIVTLHRSGCYDQKRDTCQGQLAPPDIPEPLPGSIHSPMAQACLSLAARGAAALRVRNIFCHFQETRNLAMGPQLLQFRVPRFWGSSLKVWDFQSKAWAFRLRRFSTRVYAHSVRCARLRDHCHAPDLRCFAGAMLLIARSHVACS